MNPPLLIIVTILVFGVIILIHEIGHFVAAKLCKVKVYEFNLGMGPVIWSSRKKTVDLEESSLLSEQEAVPDEPTRYCVRAFPIGGSVSMAGEDAQSQQKDAFCNKMIWQRFIILVAGALMNLVLGFIILVGIISTQTVVPTRIIATPQVHAIVGQGILEAGDKILKVNGHLTFSYDEVIQAILSDDDGSVNFLVQREGEKVLLNDVVFPTTIEGNSRQLDLNIKFKAEKNTIIHTISYSFQKGVFLGRMIWFSLGDLITGKVGFDQLSGPIGVGEALGQAASQNTTSFFALIAFLTINIGIFNLLPLPALDGGRLVFLAIEAITRKRIPAKYEGMIHAIGLLLLFGLMIAITLKDLIKLF